MSAFLNADDFIRHMAFLADTHMPAVITEPLFYDHAEQRAVAESPRARSSTPQRWPPV
jgi:N-acetylmuramoyl-L-alanine amidase